MCPYPAGQSGCKSGKRRPNDDGGSVARIGALAAVIPAEYEPEALKAQAVILRSSRVAGGHLEETVLENGTTGAAQESISK